LSDEIITDGANDGVEMDANDEMGVPKENI
jgi:hypothetical protein